MADTIGNVDFKGSFPGSGAIGKQETVWLYEGDIARQEGEVSGFKEEWVATRSARLRVGSLVEIWDDDYFTYDNLSGVPIVRKLQSTGNVYYGVIEFIEYNSITPSTDTPVTAIADQMSQNLLRRARVAFPGLQGTREVIVYAANGGSPVKVGDPGTVKYDKDDERFVSAASGGAGLLPFHHVEEDALAIVGGRVLLGIGVVPMVGV